MQKALQYSFAGTIIYFVVKTEMPVRYLYPAARRTGDAVKN
jgi:hypothetical protein